MKIQVFFALLIAGVIDGQSLAQQARGWNFINSPLLKKPTVDRIAYSTGAVYQLAIETIRSREQRWPVSADEVQQSLVMNDTVATTLHDDFRGFTIDLSDLSPELKHLVYRGEVTNDIIAWTCTLEATNAWIHLQPVGCEWKNSDRNQRIRKDIGIGESTEVSILQNGDIWVREKQIEASSLGAEIVRIIGDDPSNFVVVLYDPKVSTRQLVAVMDQLRRVGVSATLKSQQWLE